MLRHLIESHPTEHRWRTVTPVAALSAAAHSVVIAWWLLAIMGGSATPVTERETPRAQFVGIAPEDARRPNAPLPLPPKTMPLNAGGTAVRAAPKYLPSTGEGPVVGDRPLGFQELAIPTAAKGIPALDSIAQVPVSAADFSGRGIAGGVGAGKRPDGPIASTASEVAIAGDSIGTPNRVPHGAKGQGDGQGQGDWYDAAQLDDPPSLTNGDELQRVLQRLFPQQLRAAGVGGRVDAEFVIDTTGTVIWSTFRIIASPNELLSAATRRAFGYARFKPGSIQYRNRTMLVQVRVTMPIEWLISDQRASRS